MSMETYLDTITTGDALELSRDLPEESIDLVFCDPPYLKRHIETGIYSWLAEEAARVLRPGGFCLAYTGTGWLPLVLSQMGGIQKKIIPNQRSVVLTRDPDLPTNRPDIPNRRPS